MRLPGACRASIGCLAPSLCSDRYFWFLHETPNQQGANFHTSHDKQSNSNEAAPTVDGEESEHPLREVLLLQPSSQQNPGPPCKVGTLVSTLLEPRSSVFGLDFPETPLNLVEILLHRRFHPHIPAVTRTLIQHPSLHQSPPATDFSLFLDRKRPTSTFANHPAAQPTCFPRSSSLPLRQSARCLVRFDWWGSGIKSC